MGSRGSNPHGNQDEGWTKVQKPMRIDPQKMKFSSKVSLLPSFLIFDKNNVKKCLVFYCRSAQLNTWPSARKV